MKRSHLRNQAVRNQNRNRKENTNRALRLEHLDPRLMLDASSTFLAVQEILLSSRRAAPSTVQIQSTECLDCVVDLELSQSADRDFAIDGDIVSFELEIANRAPDGVTAASDVQIATQLPAGLMPLSVVPTGQSTFEDGLWTLNAPLPAGSSEQLFVTAEVDVDAMHGVSLLGANASMEATSGFDLHFDTSKVAFAPIWVSDPIVADDMNEDGSFGIGGDSGVISITGPNGAVSVPVFAADSLQSLAQRIDDTSPSLAASVIDSMGAQHLVIASSNGMAFDEFGAIRLPSSISVQESPGVSLTGRTQLVAVEQQWASTPGDEAMPLGIPEGSVTFHDGRMPATVVVGPSTRLIDIAEQVNAAENSLHADLMPDPVGGSRLVIATSNQQVSAILDRPGFTLAGVVLARNPAGALEFHGGQFSANSNGGIAFQSNLSFHSHAADVEVDGMGRLSMLDGDIELNEMGDLIVRDTMQSATSLRIVSEVVAVTEPDPDSLPNNDDGDQSEDDEVASEIFVDMYMEPPLEDPTFEPPAIEPPTFESPVIEEPILDSPTFEPPMLDLPTIEEPTFETPVEPDPDMGLPDIAPPVLDSPTFDMPEDPPMDPPLLDPPPLDTEPIVEPGMQFIDLQLTQSVSSSSAAVGDSIAWTVTLENSAEQATLDATGVEVLNLLPPGLDVLSTSSTAGDYVAGIWRLDMPLAPGQTESLQVITEIARVEPSMIRMLGANATLEVDGTFNLPFEAAKAEFALAWVSEPITDPSVSAGVGRIEVVNPLGQAIIDVDAGDSYETIAQKLDAVVPNAQTKLVMIDGMWRLVVISDVANQSSDSGFAGQQLVPTVHIDGLHLHGSIDALAVGQTYVSPPANPDVPFGEDDGTLRFIDDSDIAFVRVGPESTYRDIAAQLNSSNSSFQARIVEDAASPDLARLEISASQPTLRDFLFNSQSARALSAAPGVVVARNPSGAVEFHAGQFSAGFEGEIAFESSTQMRSRQASFDITDQGELRLEGSNVKISPNGELELQDFSMTDAHLMAHAEVLHANEVDIDSMPANDDGDQSEDDEASAELFVDTLVEVDAHVPVELFTSVNTMTAKAGDSVTWTVLVKTDPDATHAAEGIRIQNLVPEHTTSTLITVSEKGQIIDGGWSLIEPLAPGESASITIVTTVNHDAPVGTVIRSEPIFVDETTRELIPSSDAPAELIVEGSEIDLELTHSVDRHFVSPGEPVRWSISLYNNNEWTNATATNVLVESILPSGFVVEEVLGAGNYSDGIWTVPRLEPGQFVSVDLFTRAPDQLPVHVGLIGAAHVLHADQPDVDSMPGVPDLSRLSPVLPDPMHSDPMEDPIAISPMPDGTMPDSGMLEPGMLEPGMPDTDFLEPNVPDPAMEDPSMTDDMLAPTMPDSVEAQMDDYHEDDQAYSVVSVRPVIDLELSQEADLLRDANGHFLQLELMLFNNPNHANTSATGVTVSAMLPPELDVARIIDVESGLDQFAVEWNLDHALLPGESVSRTYRIDLHSSPNGDTSLGVKTEVMSADQMDADSSPANAFMGSMEDDDAMSDVYVEPVLLLDASVFADRDMVTGGEDITWTVVIKNDSDSNLWADQFHVDGFLPPGVIPVMTTASSGFVTEGTWRTASPLGPGEQETLTIVTAVDATLAGGTHITSAPAIRPVEMNDPRLRPVFAEPAVVVVQSTIDLELTQHLETEQLIAGEMVRLNVELANNATSANSVATGVTVAVTIPPELDVIHVDGVGQFDNGIWTLPAMAPGSLANLDLEARLVRAAEEPLWLGSQVIGADQQDVDSMPSNAPNMGLSDTAVEEDDSDFDWLTTVGNVIDLELTSHVSTDNAKPGETVIWTLALHNNAEQASAAATGVTVTDFMPDGLILHDVVASHHSHLNGNDWALGQALEPGDTAHLVLVTELDDRYAGGVQLVNTAFVEMANEQDVDSTPGNLDFAEDDAAQSTLFIDGMVDLELQTNVDQFMVHEGDLINWTVAIRNNSATANMAATGVGVELMLPDGFEIVGSVLPDDTELMDGIWSINRLEPGETLTMELQADATMMGGYQLEAQIFSQDQTDFDSSPANRDMNMSFGEDDEGDVQIAVLPAMEVEPTPTPPADEEPGDIGVPVEPPTESPAIPPETLPTDGEQPIAEAPSDTPPTDAAQDPPVTAPEDVPPGEEIPPVEMPVDEMPVEEMPTDPPATEPAPDGDPTDTPPPMVDLTPEEPTANLPADTMDPPDETEMPVDEPDSEILPPADEPADVTPPENEGNETDISIPTEPNPNEEEDGLQALGLADEPDLNTMSSTGARIEHQGEVVVVVGSGQDEEVVLDLSGSQYQLSVNADAFSFDPAEVKHFRISGGGGSDSVWIVGSSQDEMLDVVDRNGELTSESYTVKTFDFANTQVFGFDGNDYAKVFGSQEADRLESFPEETTLTTPNATIRVVAFDRVDAFGRGGDDVASVFGSMDADSLYVLPTHQVLLTDLSTQYSKGFERIALFGRGGDDAAELVAARSVDTLFANANEFALRGPTREVIMESFEMARATAGEGQQPSIDVDSDDLDFLLEAMGDWIAS